MSNAIFPYLLKALNKILHFNLSVLPDAIELLMNIKVIIYQVILHGQYI